MPTVNLPFSKEEYEQLKQQKGSMSWHDFMLSITTSVQTKKDEEIKQQKDILKRVQEELLPKYNASIQQNDELKGRIVAYQTLFESTNKEKQRLVDFIMGKNLWDEYLKTSSKTEKTQPDDNDDPDDDEEETEED
jgi:hypothetical protein